MTQLVPGWWSMGDCAAGQCNPRGIKATVRCGRHAHRAGRESMEKQGWVCINEYGVAGKPVTSEWLAMVNAIHTAGMDMQYGAAGWDDQTNKPLTGVWAPRVAAVILAFVKGELNEYQIVQALQASKADPDFCQAVDAAWRLGGEEAAHAVILEKLPYAKLRKR